MLLASYLLDFAPVLFFSFSQLLSSDVLLLCVALGVDLLFISFFLPG